MKTFITGGSGLMGANLIRELIERGHHVRALVRKGSDLRSLKRLDIELYKGDLSDEQNLYKGCRGFDNVIHAAAMTPLFNCGNMDFMRANYQGTQKMVGAADRAEVNRIIYVSSSCVFGGGTMDCPGTELSEFTGFRYNSAYINSKYLAQQWILSEVERKGLPVVVVNPTIMLGPYDCHPSSGRIILNLLHQHLQFCPVGGKNFIDVRDAAVATCNALTKGILGECYLLASQNLTFTELFEKISKMSGKDVPGIPVPGFILDSFGLTMDLIGILTKRTMAFSYSDASQLTCSSYFSGAKAVRDLDLPQRPVDEAIYDAIKWFKTHKCIKFREPHMSIIAATA
ncbi:MAG: NAD-dependent epimerase/dehydratase family protein [Lentimicrobium sp.]